ncbi:peroxide stress protein YaaA [Lutibacter sp.]|uniref:peroxide stress protein YaaA n=1 Tax=Lutibacter sp. TaxID=1925666 RepID=UPI0027348BC0|nr:peroxide stress protein YaaA [Lutibacter sp.]MDP3311975.1 peroxide stress protein YaaA [Lutibacter sp.]
MKIVISPAKSLDFESKLPTKEFSQGIFLEEAAKINAVLKKKTPKKLSQLMDISINLSELNWQRNQDWQLPFTIENARQSIFAFKGDVYLGLNAYNIPAEKYSQLQSKLRILSGQYGLLKPFDLIKPYRLEMGTNLKIGRKNNLYQFWDSKMTHSLNSEMDENEILVNLASTEYFKAIKTKMLIANVITPVFKDYKDGKLKMIGFFAKKARGLMVRYILDHSIEEVENIKGFNYEGYHFDANLSTKSEFVFTR